MLRSTLLSMSATLTVRTTLDSRAAPTASASLRRQRSSSCQSGRKVTIDTCSDDGTTVSKTSGTPPSSS